MKKLITAAIAATVITTPAHAEVPWAVQQFLNGFFASMIFNAATASTPEAPVYKSGVANGVFWVGDNSAVVLKKTSGVDSVRYRFKKLPLNDDGTGSFDQVGEITVAAATPVALGQYATEPALYAIEATMLSGGSPVGVVKKIEFMTLTRPTVTLQGVSAKVVSLNSASPIAATVTIQSDIEPTKVSMAIGDTGRVSIATKAGAPGLYSANLAPFGNQAGPYPIVTTVYFNKATAQSTSAADSLVVITPPKLSLLSAPKLLDATFGDAINTINVKLKNTSPEATLPSTSLDGTKKFGIAWYVLGNFVVNQEADQPFNFKFDATTYAAMKASGLKKLPVTAVAYHKDYVALTAAATAYSIDTVAAWAMPDWKLESGYADPLPAPNTSRLSLVPLSGYDTAAAKKHKLKWLWTFPVSPDFVAKANGTVLNFKIAKPGHYPVSITSSDDTGASRTYTTTIVSVQPTLKVDTVTLVASPTSGRVPVALTPRTTTSSSHPSERISSYQILVDGTQVYNGSTIKPVRITEPGDHAITVKATSNYGNVAEKVTSFIASENQPPVCGNFRVSSSTSKDGSTNGILIGTQCSDPDGRIIAYSWKVNGTPALGTNPSRSYAFAGCEQQVVLTSFAKDDSGDTTEHTETILRKVLPANCP